MGGKLHHQQQIIFNMMKGFERQAYEVQKVAKSEELEVREIAIRLFLDIRNQEPPGKKG